MNKAFVYSFGCKVNRYESQLIIEKLLSDGFEISDNPADCSLIVFNSCSVTEKADSECLYFIRKSLKLKQKPKIIIAGCSAINKYESLKANFPEVEIIKDKTSLYIDGAAQSLNSFPFSRAFLKIQDGCNAFCSYCIVPFIRNSLWSKEKSAVLSEIENFVKKGYCEIVLSGVHIGKYEGGLSSLLEKIIKIPLDFRIRISSIEINEIDDKMLSLMSENKRKICPHLHIPLQSASDKILKLMNRKYSAKNFEKKINEIARRIENIALTADIIAGFPQESAADHKETCDFIKRNPFSRLHIFRYSERGKTAAASLSGKVKDAEKKERSMELAEIDREKRAHFLRINEGKTRQCVSIGANRALSDNYIDFPIERRLDGIFDAEIPKNGASKLKVKN